MASNASSVWYWNDWTGDLALKKCSRAAQGFWMQLLAIAAAATPRGHIVVGNKPCTVDDLSLLLSDRKRDIKRWLTELEANKVFSRTEDGTMFCRRMVREDEARRSRGSQSKAKRKLNRSNKSPKQLELPETESEKTPPQTQEEQSSSSQDPLSLESSLTPLTDVSEEEEQVKIEIRDPEGGRFAPLGDLVRPIAHRLTGRSPPKPKGRALQAQIKAQLAWKHCRYLTACGRPGEDAWYFALIDGKTCLPPQEIFDAVDRRMRAARWDDIRENTWQAAA
ncbi:MAG TPA: hypothetical protein VLN57_13465 [Xanthobacteraceae bacterium]|nr:hypothetical protein [Xanthobacteraceae bacterium]